MLYSIYMSAIPNTRFTMFSQSSSSNIITEIVLTLWALCQESDKAGPSCFGYNKKREATSLLTLPLLRGGYLRRPMPLTIGVGTLRALCQESEVAEPSRQDR